MEADSSSSLRCKPKHSPEFAFKLFSLAGEADKFFNCFKLPFFICEREITIKHKCALHVNLTL